MKVAICGLRHNHVASLVREIQDHANMRIVGVVEAQPEACREVMAAGNLHVTHPSLEAMLNDLDFDILALGDVYAHRGGQAIAALQAGKHLMADKPLCTSMKEFERIEELALANCRSILLQLSLRYRPSWSAARQALAQGLIGDIQTVHVTGRHPMKYKTGRPDWYFEPNLHGGTINDLFIHGMDSVEWLTGLQVQIIHAARAWNQAFHEEPAFQNAAQAMLELNNGAGVLMDASYTSPEGHSESWVFHFNGSQGDLRLAGKGPAVLRRHHEPERLLEMGAANNQTPLTDLLDEMAGLSHPTVLSTRECLRATRLALSTQQLADQRQPGHGVNDACGAIQ